MPRPPGMEGFDAVRWIREELDAMGEAMAILGPLVHKHPAISRRIERIKEALDELERLR